MWYYLCSELVSNGDSLRHTGVYTRKKFEERKKENNYEKDNCFTTSYVNDGISFS